MESHGIGRPPAHEMNRRRVIFSLLLLSALAAPLAARFDGTAASNHAQGGGEKSLKKTAHRNPVTEIVRLKVKGVPVEFDRKITADDDWLKGLTVTVKNTSLKPITYLEVELELFGKEDEASGRLPVVYPLSYGTYTGNTPAPDGPPASEVIEPGGLADITLTDEVYASLLMTLSASGYPVTMKHVQLTVTDVIFADGSRWYKGMTLRRDPANPAKWLKVKDVGQNPRANKRPLDSASRGSYGVKAPFFG